VLLLGLAISLGTVALSGCWRTRVTHESQTNEDSVPLPRLSESVEPSSQKIVTSLESSVHAKLDCTACHVANEKLARAGELGKGQCASCHAKEAAAYNETVHATATTKGKKEGATCQDCHGIHEVKAVSDPSSLVSPRNTPQTCGKCHENPDVAKKLGIKAPLAGSQYFESIHGTALFTQGLVVAPSCVSCHGKAHRLFQASDPRSSVNRANIADTCGQCHTGERERFATSVHGEALRKELAGDAPGDRPNVATGKKPPTCSGCHTAHQIVKVGPQFRLASDQICGNCHQERLKRYLETYHGRAIDLGDEDVAACYSCHGSHDILPSSNPASRLSKENRLATCQSCHPGGTQKFSEYFAHADHSDRQHYPILFWAFTGMTWLLLGTFGFFGIHTLLWLGRTLVLRMRNPQAFREAKERARKEEGARLYQRFRPIDRFVHALVIVSFTLLVMTGMPLKFHATRWAHAIFDAIGGAAIARSTHRFAAIITVTYFVIHIASLVKLVRRHRQEYVDDRGRFQLRRFLRLAFGPDSPFPRWQDVKDVAGNMKWFFGLGPRPRFDRFTYWEKFDYIAVFWGVTVIGLSGFVLWMPELVTLFLPGWAINVAHIVHSDEALLAAGFIFTFHFFNSHFRPEKFPFDAVMFSGQVTEEELKQERPALYDRMAKSGELEHFENASGWHAWKSIVVPFGVVAIILGLVLAVMIFASWFH
jgi:cytochrome b subunit of formate dehydrogenase/nitrate/TMAO reductase-like tetraheme cytochrome c subunit